MNQEKKTTVEDGEPLGKNGRWRVNHLSAEWYIDKKPLEPDLCMHSQEMHWVNVASDVRRCKGDGCECEIRLVGGRWRKL